MIVVKLSGGLGNQMFQYAAGRRLSHKLGVMLKLDISNYVGNNPRSYDLRIFNIQENFAQETEIRHLKTPNLFQRCLAKIQVSFSEYTSTYVREKHFGFDPNILELPNNIYLEGYWQSEKYFIDIAAIIREEFRISEPSHSMNKKLGEQIQQCTSVAVHIRRGDYITNSIANCILGPCSLDYYYRSIDELSKFVSNPHFFIFSDEPQWAKASLQLAYPVTYVDINGPSHSYEDMRLMSQCKHHIIANSSFSWWGAWLCENPNKIVISPQKWFNDPAYSTADLIPVSWIQL